MNCKKPINLVILGMLLLGNIENSNAQFLKKLKDKVSKSVTETVDKISSKKIKQKNLSNLILKKKMQKLIRLQQTINL